MSAVAAVVMKEETTLLSDGIVFHVPDDLEVHDNLKRKDFKIHDTETPKIHKISQQVGISWVGTHVPSIQYNLVDIMDDAGAVASREVAETLSKRLQSYHEGKHHLIQRDNYNIKIAVTGYDSTGIPWGFDVGSNSPDNRPPFAVKGTKITQEPYASMCSIPFMKGENSDFNRLMEKHAPKHNFDARNTAKAAFTEMIRDYEAQGHIVGGKIFMEVLTP